MTANKTPEIVTINGQQYEALEWDWRDEDADGVVTWHLYASKVDAPEVSG